MPFIPFIAAAIGGAYAAEKVGDWFGGDENAPPGIPVGQLLAVVAVLGGVWMLTKGRA